MWKRCVGVTFFPALCWFWWTFLLWLEPNKYTVYHICLWWSAAPWGCGGERKRARGTPAWRSATKTSQMGRLGILSSGGCRLERHNILCTWGTYKTGSDDGVSGGGGGRGWDRERERERGGELAMWLLWTGRPSAEERRRRRKWWWRGGWGGQANAYYGMSVLSDGGRGYYVVA